MDILQLIKKRKSIRKYKKRKIPKKILDKVIEAGIWGPAIIGMQPWKLVVVQNREKIESIHNILKEKAKNMEAGGRFIFYASMKAVSGSDAIIAFYNTGKFTESAKKFDNIYTKFSREAEISAISASIQNAILTAESYNIGSCWLHTPVFCEKKISKLFDIQGELIAILTLGYPDEAGGRTPRKPFDETVVYIK